MPYTTPYQTQEEFEQEQKLREKIEKTIVIVKFTGLITGTVIFFSIGFFTGWTFESTNATAIVQVGKIIGTIALVFGILGTFLGPD